MFTASTDIGSGRGTSRFIGPVVRWLWPSLSEAQVDLIVFLVRKTAHLAEYALLALLLWRALGKPVKGEIRPWDWRLAGWAALGAALYACTDEFHQSFVPSRLGSVWDVLLDTTGATAGMLAFRVRHWCRGRTTAN